MNERFVWIMQNYMFSPSLKSFFLFLPSLQKFCVLLVLCLLLHDCNCQWISKQGDDKKEPYSFNETELSTIQAIVAFRQVFNELVEKVAMAWPALASVIVRSDSSPIAGNAATSTPSRHHASLSALSSSSGALGSRSRLGTALLRGMTLSLPLLIPMAPTIIRRMSAPSNGIIDNIVGQLGNAATATSNSASSLLGGGGGGGGEMAVDNVVNSIAPNYHPHPSYYAPEAAYYSMQRRHGQLPLPLIEKMYASRRRR